MTRMVVTGKHQIYMGKTFGNVYYPTVELKGSPVEWVQDAMKIHPEEQLNLIIGKLAKDEAVLYPFTKKMGHKAFWRNAYAYFKNRVKNV